MNSNSFRITVLVENTVRKSGLLGEHGLSYWIAVDKYRVLFDTGQGQTLAHNTTHLGIDLARANAIVLSHGHYDHTGGLRFAFNIADKAKLFLHPQAQGRRYSMHNGQGREIGFASLTEQELQQDSKRLVWTHQPMKVVPGVFVTGPIPRQTDYEDTGGDFYLDPKGEQADPILDDQAIYMKTGSGVVVLLGCAHAGVINTLNYIRTLVKEPIHSVIGGMHLVHASPLRMAQTITALRQMNLHCLAPAHCTGPAATAALWSAFPEQIADSSVGAQWKFAQPT